MIERISRLRRTQRHTHLHDSVTWPASTQHKTNHESCYCNYGVVDKTW